MNSETKTCPYCTEAVKVHARVCPRCRQWLVFRSLRNPAFASLVFTGTITVIYVPLLILFLVRMEQSFNPRPLYHEAPQKLRLTESRMNWKQFDSGLRVVLTGVVTNDSNIPWEDVKFECRFFDTNGSIIDVANASGYTSVQPHDDAAFRLFITPSRDTNVYSSYKLTIVDARNGRRGF